jgi:hypothetical protein
VFVLCRAAVPGIVRGTLAPKAPWIGVFSVFEEETALMAHVVNGTLSALPGSARFAGSKTRRHGRFLWAALVACILLLAASPVTAHAAAATTPTPAANGTLDLQTWPEGGQLIIVTALEVPDTVKLPAIVRIPVVQGATVNWAGEVLGGDLNADPARKYVIKKSPAGGQYAEFTLEQTRSAQVDASMPGLTINGNSTTGTFEWIQSVSSPFTSFSVRVPPNSSGVVVSPQPSSLPQQNASGESLYSGDPMTLAPGARQKVSFTYTTGAAGAGSSRTGSMNTLIFLLIAALIVAVVALVIVASRQRSGGAQPPAASGSRGTAKKASASTSGSGKRPAKTPSPPAADEPQEHDSEDDAWGFDVED